MLDTDSGCPYYVESGHFSSGSYKVDLLTSQEPFAPLEHIFCHLPTLSAYIHCPSKVIPEGVAEEDKPEATKTWKLDRWGRALIALSTHAKASRTLLVYEPSFFISTYQPPLFEHLRLGRNYGHITHSLLAEKLILDSVLEHTFLSSYARAHNCPIAAPYCSGYGLLYPCIRTFRRGS